MSQSSLNTFNFQGQTVRTVIGTDGEPRWVAKDVADALGYTWNGNARINHVPAEWRQVTSVVTTSGDKEMAVLTEAGLFFFLGRSDKPLALPMQKWIAGEVLPTIRKTGTYSVKTLSPAEMLLSQAQVLVDHERQIQTLQTRVESVEAKYTAIESRAQEALQSLATLPAPDVHPADLTTRAKVNRIVRDHCFKTSMEHREAWISLYREFRDRYHLDLVERAKHRGLKPLEVAELEGQLENLYAVAYTIFGCAA